VIALGLRQDAEAADELARCALRHPNDVVQSLEVIKSLKRLPPGAARAAALHALHVQHPASAVRKAAAGALAGGRDPAARPRAVKDGPDGGT